MAIRHCIRAQWNLFTGPVLYRRSGWIPAKKYIYQATVDAMAAEGRPFQGVIFFGLMLTTQRPSNGSTMQDSVTRRHNGTARMKNDIMRSWRLVWTQLGSDRWQVPKHNAAVCAVLASDGYPKILMAEKGVT